MSNAIAKLEAELDVRLFLRYKRSGLKLTDIGKEILVLARQMEEASQRMVELAYKEKHLKRGRLRIAVLTSLISTILSKALKEYRRQYPDIQIEFKEGTPNDIFNMIEEHAADVAISCAPFGKFDAVPLIHDRMMAIFPPESADKMPVNLSQTPELLIINKPAYETLLDHLVAKAPIKTDRRILVQTAESAIRMAADGIGVGILSEYTLNTLAPDVPKYPVLPEITFDIGLFANDLADLTPAAAEFVRVIRAIQQ